MVKQTRKWVCSHKKVVAAVTVAGLCVGGYYGAKKWLQNKENEFLNAQMLAMKEHQYTVGFGKTQKEFDVVIVRFLPLLRDRLAKLANVQAVVVQLRKVKKQEPKNKELQYDLWDEVVLMSIFVLVFLI
jgi:hypothetical protein